MREHITRAISEHIIVIWISLLIYRDVKDFVDLYIYLDPTAALSARWQIKGPIFLPDQSISDKYLPKHVDG